MKVTILGSGTSSGVPRIGNQWGACDPHEPRNRRTRASILIDHGETRILVDTSPDMREQLLRSGVATVDAIIWTHDHADHCHGIDDVRQLFHNARAPVRGYAFAETLRSLEDRFGYAFRGRSGYPPTIQAEILPDALTIGDIRISVVPQPHGSISSAGLRFEAGGLAIGYATDLSAMTPDLMTLYAGLDVWIVDALRREPHPTHPTVDDVLGWVEALAPAATALVHMDHSMDYATLCRELPDGVEPGYDGLTLPLAALVARRPALGTTLKMALAWLGIFLVALVVVGQRHRIAAMVMPLIADQSVSGDTVRISMAGDGHFYADASIDGVRRRMLIDSGATTTALSVATARAAGLDTEQSPFPEILATANGPVGARTARVKRLTVGSITATDLAVVVSPAFGDMDVLGMNFLSRLGSWRAEGAVLILVPNHR